MALRGRRGSNQKIYGSNDQSDVTFTSDFALSADLFCRTLVISKCTLTTNGYRIFASNAIHLVGNIVAPALIDCSGSDGVGGAGGGTGGAGGPGVTMGGGFSGGLGGTLAGSNGNGTSQYSLANTSGGDGGVSVPLNVAGLGGSATFNTAVFGYQLQPSVTEMGMVFGIAAGFNRVAGGPGGGGGAGDGVRRGGGGGGGGGIIGIWTGGDLTLTGYARIQVPGGNGGGAQAGGGASGGGGGAGGALLLNAERILFPDASLNARLMVDAGAGGGHGGGLGGNGFNGNQGGIWIVSARGHRHFAGTITGDIYPAGLPDMV